MPTLVSLIESWYMRESLRFPAQMAAWMLRISQLVDAGSSGFAVVQLVMPDANSEVAFGGVFPGANITGLAGSINFITCTPTSDLTLLIDRPDPAVFTDPTIVKIQNFSTANFIDFSFSSGTNPPLNPTYVPPGGIVNMTYLPGIDTWVVEPYTQAGTIVLVSGLTFPAIKADITANSRIVCSLRQWGGAAGVGDADIINQVIGTRAGAGEFHVISADQATGGVVGTDGGTYDWHIINQAG